MVEDASASWKETVPDDEADAFRALAVELNRYQETFARRGDGQAYRGFHVKSHAGLAAEFRVQHDLPARARHGVFRAARSFPAWVRLTNGFSAARTDWLPDLLGFAIKLRDVDGDKLFDDRPGPATQDFLTLNQAQVPAADARQLMIMSMSAAHLLRAPFQLIRRLGVAQTARSLWWTLGWTPHRIVMSSIATECFHGLTPMTIGPHAVKYCLLPRSPRSHGSSGLRGRNFLRDDLRRRLADDDVTFDFMAQFYVDPIRTPIDGAYAWNPQDAPFEKLAEVVLLRCDLDAEETKQTEAHLRNVSFSPWNTIAEHRPIGNIQRARRVLYDASARFRGREGDSAGEGVGRGEARDA